MAHLLGTLIPGKPLWHTTMNVVAVLCWWRSATLADSNFAVVVLGAVRTVGIATL